jgi:hypothetical protein
LYGNVEIVGRAGVPRKDPQEKVLGNGHDYQPRTTLYA